MAEYDKSVLLDLSKEAPNNRCMDCGSPHPQWASVNHGVFICLECSGEHRSLGVHISFVRSLTMDKWTPEQIQKMKTGGNAKATAFFQASPEYSSTMTITQKYHTHFASQYREKLLCDIEGRTFVPSAAPPPSESTSSLRKPRSTTAGSGRVSPANPPSRSGTPVTNASVVGGQANPYAGNLSAAAAQKAANEDFFGRMGAANASRSADLPPSQGGKYAGFGSGPMTPTESSANHPSNITSSRALPTINDLQNDPLKALGKGWGLFSSTLSQATKQINESVIQPGLARANDPDLQRQLQDYASKSGGLLQQGLQRGQNILGEGVKYGGDWAKTRGIDTSYLDQMAGSNHNNHRYPNADPYGDGGYTASSNGADFPPHQTSLESQEGGFADLPTPPPVPVGRVVNQTYPGYGSTGATAQKKPQAQQTQPEEEEDFFESQLKSGSGRSTPSTMTGAENGMRGMSLGSSSSTSSAPKRPLGRKGLGAVRSATPPSARPKDDDWDKFD